MTLQLPNQLLAECHFSIMLSTLHDLPRLVDVQYKSPLRRHIRSLIVTFSFSLQTKEMSLNVHALCVSGKRIKE